MENQLILGELTLKNGKMMKSEARIGKASGNKTEKTLTQRMTIEMDKFD